MFYILAEDIGKILEVVGEVVATLGNGTKRVDKEVDIGDQTNPIKISGYWVNDIIRIDIKVKHAGSG